MLKRLIDWMFYPENRHQEITRRSLLKGAPVAAAGIGAALTAPKIVAAPALSLSAYLNRQSDDGLPVMASVSFPNPGQCGLDLKAILGQFVDRSEWIYWDTIYARGCTEVPAGAAFYPFSLPTNHLDPVTALSKTLHDTNLFWCQSFGPIRSFILAELGVYFPLSMADEQIDAILSSALLEFHIGEKVFHQHRFDLSEVRELRDGKQIEVNTNRDGSTESLALAEFSERAVKIRIQAEYRRYIAPLMPFYWRISFSNPVRLEFTGVRPIMVATMKGLCDRAIQ